MSSSSRDLTISLQATRPSDALQLGDSPVHYLPPPIPHNPPPPQINVLLLFFNKALPDQMLTPAMIAQPGEGISSKSPFK